MAAGVCLDSSGQPTGGREESLDTHPSDPVVSHEVPRTHSRTWSWPTLWCWRCLSAAHGGDFGRLPTSLDADVVLRAHGG